MEPVKLDRGSSSCTRLEHREHNHSNNNHNSHNSHNSHNNRRHCTTDENQSWLLYKNSPKPPKPDPDSPNDSHGNNGSGTRFLPLNPPPYSVMPPSHQYRSATHYGSVIPPPVAPLTSAAPVEYNTSSFPSQQLQSIPMSCSIVTDNQHPTQPYGMITAGTQAAHYTDSIRTRSTCNNIDARHANCGYPHQYGSGVSYPHAQYPYEASWPSVRYATPYSYYMGSNGSLSGPTELMPNHNSIDMINQKKNFF
ncbi:hypothetical protein HELRODRAFT_169390 [Helobdella robusta]|uniref:Uncharacterized protein n=1 Tax=Helobdella robusta TaxID=6412 RepID=T1F1W0_HELRO|nr:hypothetical protein HELRODRAFT_169390 [Helobdella robusta]ESO08529.1 hypothetical protein HELRODRAFT_169390 [Helobdella robusta]